MGYRKLIVDGKEYQYVIGKKFTKVKLPNDRKALIIENQKIGYVIAYQNSGSPYNEDGMTFKSTDRVMVTPGSIADYIRTGKSPVVNKCNRDDCGCVGSLVADPFGVEIHGKLYFVKACARCYSQSAAEI